MPPTFLGHLLKVSKKFLITERLNFCPANLFSVHERFSTGSHGADSKSEHEQESFQTGVTDFNTLHDMIYRAEYSVLYKEYNNIDTDSVL